MADDLVIDSSKYSPTAQSAAPMLGGKAGMLMSKIKKSREKKKQAKASKGGDSKLQDD